LIESVVSDSVGREFRRQFRNWVWVELSSMFICGVLTSGQWKLEMWPIRKSVTVGEKTLVDQWGMERVLCNHRLWAVKIDCKGMCELIQSCNPGPIIIRHGIPGHMTMIMGSDGAPNQERPCWRSPAPISWTGLEFMVMSPVKLGTKNHCGGEAQRQFTSQTVNQTATIFCRRVVSRKWVITCDKEWYTMVARHGYAVNGQEPDKRSYLTVGSR
jgi:hypothetical protein